MKKTFIDREWDKMTTVEAVKIGKNIPIGEMMTREIARLTDENTALKKQLAEATTLLIEARRLLGGKIE